MERDQYLQINRPANQCALCGEPLRELPRHASVLDEKDGRPERMDLCPTCWKEARNPRYFSFWLTRRARPAPDRKQAKAARNEILWRLFSALTTHTAPEMEPQRFLLAHLLMKFGVLRWRPAEPGEQEQEGMVAFEHVATGEVFKVRERALDAAALVACLQEIEERVAREMNPSLRDAAPL